MGQCIRGKIAALFPPIDFSKAEERNICVEVQRIKSQLTEQLGFSFLPPGLSLYLWRLCINRMLKTVHWIYINMIFKVAVQELG